MKRFGLILCCGMMLLTGCGKQSTEQPVASTSEITQQQMEEKDEEKTVPVQEGEKAADVAFELQEGDTFVLSEHRQTPVILYFWAGWCMTQEDPFAPYEKLSEEYGDRIRILLVHTGESREDGQTYLKKHTTSLPVAWDTDGTAAKRFASGGMPYAVIIDTKGRIHSVLEGAADAQAVYDACTEAVDSILGE